MKTNRTISVFRFNDSDIYERIFCGDAHVFFKAGISAAPGGSVDTARCIVRVPTSKNLGFKTDDVCVLCRTDSIADSDRLCVTTVNDNRVGRNPHWRFDCV